LILVGRVVSCQVVKALAVERRTKHNILMEITWLKVPHWEKYGDLLQGFLGRRGGKSAGPYSGLNLSFRVGDEDQVVKDNMCDMKRAVGVHDGRIVTMKQVHGGEIVQVKDGAAKEVGEADGMVTQEKKVYLGVLTADCVPILFIAPGWKLVAAVHAGWRGTVEGIAAKLVHRLWQQHGIAADGVEAALGPAIGACCYEVKDDVSRPLIERWGDLAKPAVQHREGKTFLDLRRVNRAILAHAGVPADQIYQIGPCTSCTPEEFFSYRRERNETGRQISFIGWTG
jgi:YfiH family protein